MMMAFCGKGCANRKEKLIFIEFVNFAFLSFFSSSPRSAIFRVMSVYFSDVCRRACWWGIYENERVGKKLKKNLVLNPIEIVWVFSHYTVRQCYFPWGTQVTVMGFTANWFNGPHIIFTWLEDAFARLICSIYPPLKMDMTPLSVLSAPCVFVTFPTLILY